MFLLVLFGLSIATVPLAGGHLSELASIKFQRTWTVLVGLGIQIVIISVIPDADPILLASAHVISYFFVGAFVYSNRSQPGLWLVGSGLGLESDRDSGEWRNHAYRSLGRGLLRPEGCCQRIREFAGARASEASISRRYLCDPPKLAAAQRLQHRRHPHRGRCVCPTSVLVPLSPVSYASSRTGWRRLCEPPCCA